MLKKRQDLIKIILQAQAEGKSIIRRKHGGKIWEKSVLHKMHPICLRELDPDDLVFFDCIVKVFEYKLK